jgi:hypothetical protein
MLPKHPDNQDMSQMMKKSNWFLTLQVFIPKTMISTSMVYSEKTPGRVIGYG